ncbi:MAG: hypothetical protein Q8S26_00190 [Azonexus sp.]|nr:hypothetical protein [Azonexus sp.]
MRPAFYHLSVLSLAILSCQAGAVGFGEIVLHSRVGEPLRAEVPMLVSAGESIDTACFSLAALRGSDLPVVSAARTRLVRNGSGYRLMINGIKPIAEPIFIIGLRANCGVELQRDYVLMPSAPMMLAEAGYDAPPTVVVRPKKTGNFREWQAREGDTLESIAESQAPDSIIEQRRLLAALKRANPGISPEQPLADGTPVRIPNLRQRIPAESDLDTAPPPKPRRAQSSETPQPRPKKAVPRDTQPTLATKGADRLVLGSPPEELKAGEKAVAPRANMSEMEERMLKLETTLHTLNQEVDKLNSALALTTEALAVQNKIQAAQTAPPAGAPTVAATVATPPAADRSNQSNWLELLLSALAGGAIAAGMAHLLGRKPSHLIEDELPLAVSGYRPKIQAKPNESGAPREQRPIPATPLIEAEAVLPTTTVDIPLEAETANFEEGESSAVDVNYNDGDSALELAEIMLSFGRVRGAAETLAVHIEESSPNNIQPWSMLLDLYRRGDMRDEFAKLAETMREKFNVHVPTWEDTSTPVSGLKSLEDYAHIVWRAANSWGKQECLDYLYDLVHDNRAGQRSGFPLEVVEEIALLMRVLEEGYGLKRPN